MKRLQLLLSFLLLIALFGCAHKTEITDAADHGHPAGPKTATSTDLEADIRAMWSVALKEEGKDWVPATPEAVLAANRVFNTVDLRGLTRNQVGKKLRFDLRSPDYGYNAPFWPVAQGDFPIRIDTGFYGWQFDVHFSRDQEVTGITRRWIH